MFRKIPSERIGSNGSYYTDYEVLCSNDDFYRFLSEYSSSIRRICLSGVPHLIPDTIHGISFDQFLEIANSSQSADLYSIIITFNDEQRMYYYPYDKHLSCKTKDPDFDVEEFFLKKPEGSTPISSHPTGQKKSATENTPVRSYNAAELIKYIQLFEGMFSEWYGHLELYQNGFKISFVVDSGKINGMIRKLVNEDIVSVSTFFVRDREYDRTTSYWDEDLDGLPILIEKTEKWGGGEEFFDKFNFSWSAYESDYGELKGQSEFFKQDIEIELVANWQNPYYPDAIDTSCDPVVTVSVPDCDIAALAQYIDTYFTEKSHDNV